MGKHQKHADFTEFLHKRCGSRIFNFYNSNKILIIFLRGLVSQQSYSRNIFQQGKPWQEDICIKNHNIYKVV